MRAASIAESSREGSGTGGDRRGVSVPSSAPAGARRRARHRNTFVFWESLCLLIGCSQTGSFFLPRDPPLAFLLVAHVMVARRGCSACTLATTEHLAFGVPVNSSRLSKGSRWEYRLTEALQPFGTLRETPLPYCTAVG